MQLFVDMDGDPRGLRPAPERIFGLRACKIADNVDWNAVRAVPSFYSDIPPMADLEELWSYVAPYKPIVLTGVPRESVEEAPANKLAWVSRHLGDHVRVITCRSAEKCLYAQPGDILIDDWTKYRALWLDKGGRWITHTSAAQTIAELQALGLKQEQEAIYPTPQTCRFRRKSESLTDLQLRSVLRLTLFPCDETNRRLRPAIRAERGIGVFGFTGVGRAYGTLDTE